MPTTYEPAPHDVAAVVNARMASHHEDMRGVGVRVGVLMAENPKGPAVKLHGAPCNATIRVVPHKDRVTKGYDAEMLIDRRNWDGFTPRQREALVAHELKHLMLVKKRDRDTGHMRIQFDGGGRPKLKTRPGDWDAGDGFAEIVAEFGEDAVEFHNIKSCWKLADQAREIGLPEPAPTLLDGLTMEIVTTDGAGSSQSVTVTGETFKRATDEIARRNRNPKGRADASDPEPGE